MPNAPNRFVGVNYLDINNRMAVPPPYWLQRLFDYDNMLVVFPSMKEPYAYVLARRRQHTAGLMDKALAETITQPDTKFCLSHGLVPVSMIYRHGTGWSIDNIIASLQARDIWRVGGGDKAADLVDASEQQAEDKRKQTLRDDMWNRAGFAYDLYKRRTGQRVTSPGMGTERHAPTPSSSGSTASAGIITTDFVKDQPSPMQAR